jgi:hypothetical protein
MSIGIIAEDDSDVVVIRELTLSLIKPKKIGFKRRVGHGCGKLRRKCRVWADNLVREGCKWIIVAHDLDDYDEAKLHKELSNAIADARAQATVILIPRREIETWLLYDAEAIAKAFNERKKPKLPHNPELLPDPKDYLGKLISKEYDKEYLNTKHNELIANQVNVARLKKSQSFAAHPRFVANIFGQLTTSNPHPSPRRAMRS